jgi:NitT/TauT family transport system substrate-binding protein
MPLAFRVVSRRSLLGLAGAAALAPRSVIAQSAQKIRVATAPADSYAEPFIGMDTGAFARAGLDAEFTMLPSGAAIATAMAGGAIDVGVGDVINVAHAMLAGVPLALVAGGGLYSTNAPTTLLCVSASSTLRNPKELEGQTIGVVALSSISTLGLQEWLRKSGVDVAAVKLVEMSFPTMLPALLKGQVSAALLSEPFITPAKNQIRVLGKVFDAIAPSFYISAWFARRDWLKANTGVSERIARAAYDIARWTNAHHSESGAIEAKYLKLDAAQFSAMTRVSFGTSLDVGLVQPVLDVAYAYKQLARPVTAKEIIFGNG